MTEARPLIDLIASSIPGLEELRRAGSRSINNLGGLVFEDVNLAWGTVTSKTIDRSCFGVYYSPRGSSRGGLLTLNIGGEIKDFGPGDKITGRIERMQLTQHASSAVIGNARLVLLSSPWADFTSTVGGDAAITDLLGSVSHPVSFVAVAEDTDPDLALTVGSFDVSGWKKIRVLIDTYGSGATSATSFDLIPFVSPGSNTTWFENGLERISVPDADATTGRRYRAIVLSVSGRGRMYFAIRNLLASARTDLGFIVQGIE